MRENWRAEPNRIAFILCEQFNRECFKGKINKNVEKKVKKKLFLAYI